MRKLVTMALITLGLAIAACHTVEGAGRDVQSVGNAVADTAHDASH
jgi:predicted small secreted protein